MRTVLTFPSVFLLAIAAFSGCITDPEAADSTASPSMTSASPTDSPSPAPTSNTSTPAPAPIANLTIDVTNGTAPLEVSFAVTDDSNASQEGISWVLDFGDGNSTNGTEVPGRTNHTYEANGTFEVVLTLTSESGESSDSATITVEAAAAVLPPSRTVYESGPVIGTISEAGHGAAPAYLAGPGNEEGLGLWIELQPGHVGMSFAVTETTGGDSDGWLFAEPDGAPLSTNINNGGGEAKGVIPPEARWMLIVSWGAPSENMVVTFTPTA